MESKQYIDKSRGQSLDSKTLNQMAWRSLFLQGSFNMERMQAAGWLYGILPGLKKIHTNKEDLATSMEHNLEFFNTHPFLVTFVMGIVLVLEEQKADTNTIRAVRVAAMGPLGGIGDAIFWLTLVPIAAGIGSQFALQGNILGAFIFLFAFNIVQFPLRYWLMHWSYKLGTNAIGQLTKHSRAFTRSASILGVFIVGVLTSNFGGTTTRAMIDIGGKVINIQAEVLDVIVPKLLPLVIVLVLYYLFAKKKWTPIQGIGLLAVVALIGTAIGFFGPVSKDYKAPLDLFEKGVHKYVDDKAKADAETPAAKIKALTEALEKAGVKINK